jgi:hypothetical protein
MNMVHGVEEVGRHTLLHFGMIRLFEELAATKEEDSPVPEWTKRFNSPVFSHRVRHFKQCVEKFDRAAYHVDRCRRVAEPWLQREYDLMRDITEREQRGENVENLDPNYALAAAKRTAYHGSGYDLPLYLDLLLLYLRIQADAYATLVPFLYEGRDAGKISDHSFRNQMEWFTKTKPTFDGRYAEILQANLHWFNILAGGQEPKGLRDVLVHHGGFTQYSWFKNGPDAPWELRGGLYRNDGPREEDLYGALREMTAGWCAFLDASWHHFVPQLKEIGALPTTPFPTWLIPGGNLGDVPSSKWVYPSVPSPERLNI